MGQMADGGHNPVVLPVIQHMGIAPMIRATVRMRRTFSGCSSNGREPFAPTGGVTM